MNHLIYLAKRLLIVLIINITGTGFALANPVKFEAIITPKDDTTLSFIDGSEHLVRLVQREGKVSGEPLLDGATMLEWGIHDLMKTTGTGFGYLVFTLSPSDIVYLRFQWSGIKTKGTDGNPMFLLGGSWEVAGSSGQLSGLSGLGTLRINILSPEQRQWLFEGELVKATKNAHK